MTNEIKELIKNSTNFLICDSCEGEGEVWVFVGHDAEFPCENCGGTGLVEKSVDK